MSVPLDLDQLQSFCAIADCGSFTEAARRVNKTQSAVSMQIKRLEERLGHALLSRDGRSVALTQHGEALYSRARKMLKINAEIMDEFSDEDLSGAIRFGLPDDAEHVNPNGGAIALGHPLGASGGRLALTAAVELHDRGAARAIATMCIGVGQGIAVLLEAA